MFLKTLNFCVPILNLLKFSAERLNAQETRRDFENQHSPLTRQDSVPACHINFVEKHKERRHDEKRLHWCLFSALMVDLGTSGCIALFHRHLTTKYLARNTFPSSGSFYEHHHDVATICYLTDSTLKNNIMVFTVRESICVNPPPTNTSTTTTVLRGL